jgi:hypothetical protein
VRFFAIDMSRPNSEQRLVAAPMNILAPIHWHIEIDKSGPTLTSHGKALFGVER